MNRNQLQGGNTGNIQGWPEPCIYGVYTVFFGREITKYTVIYGAYIQCWLTLKVYNVGCCSAACVTLLFGACWPGLHLQKKNNRGFTQCSYL